MKNIKLYESINSVNFEDESYYLVNGDMNLVIKMFEIINKFNSKSLINQLITDSNKQHFNKANSFYIAKRDDDRFTFWGLNENNNKEAKTFYKKRNYVYRGELKIINDELILDTVELDQNKYNL